MEQIDIVTNHEERRALGMRILTIRTEQGITQRRFALMVGMNHTALGRLERGEVNFKFDKLERIALALGIQVKDLFDY